MNYINPHIQFTIEVEAEGSIAFLDTKTTRQEDGSIAVSVYRKATHTDRYLDFNSTTIHNTNTPLYALLWIEEKIFHPPGKKEH